MGLLGIGKIITLLHVGGERGRVGGVISGGGADGVGGGAVFDNVRNFFGR
jgi:hypothetical protein